MDKLTYLIENENEASHWWFVGRRRLLSRIIKRLSVGSSAPILDVGTGAGTNLRLLKELGFRNVIGVDNNDEAIQFCAEKGLFTVKKGDCCNLPFENDRFHVILATDILEHIDDDESALKELKRVLSPEGKLIVTVPAIKSLWGVQDKVGHHKRRYSIGQLRQLIARTGLDCEKSFYFNYIFFIPIWAARKLIKFFNIKVINEGKINAPFLNVVALKIFNLDVLTAPYIHPLCGVSICAVARK